MQPKIIHIKDHQLVHSLVVNYKGQFQAKQVVNNKDIPQVSNTQTLLDRVDHCSLLAPVYQPVDFNQIRLFPIHMV